MTKKRLLAVGGILVSVACIVLITLALLPPRPGVTKANFDRIDEGMTEAEVSLIFGKSPDFSMPGFTTPGNKIRRVSWYGDGETAARIVFYNDLATDKDWESTDTFVEKFRRWLHLP